MKAPAQLHWLALTGLLLCSASVEARMPRGAIGYADRAILEDLDKGRIVEAYPLSANAKAGRLWKVRVENEGRSCWAIFKPREYGDRDGGDRSSMANVAYRRNRSRGMDMVSPVAYRQFMWVGGNYYAEGTLQLCAEDWHGVQGRRAESRAPRREVRDRHAAPALGQAPRWTRSAPRHRAEHWRSQAAPSQTLRVGGRRS